MGRKVKVIFKKIELMLIKTMECYLKHKRIIDILITLMRLINCLDKLRECISF